MFDITNLKDYQDTIEEQIKLSKEYALYRRQAGEAKRGLDILLAANILSIKADKPNAGYDMAVILLMATNDAARIYHKEVVEAESKYKGIEKILEALQTKISFAQSVMRFEKDNT